MRLAKLAVAAGLIMTLAACERPDNDAFGARVRAYLLEHPEVIQEAQQRLAERQRETQLASAREQLPRVRQRLERDPRDFVANPNGRITVTEFYDYRCGYCATVAPEIVRLIRQNPDVRFVFKEMPILSETSERAAVAALAVRRAGGDSLGLYETFMTDRNLDNAGVNRIAASHGVAPAQLDNAEFIREVAAHLRDNAEVAQAIGITGTPGFVVGNEIIFGADMEALQAAISAERRRLGGPAATRPSAPTSRPPAAVNSAAAGR